MCARTVYVTGLDDVRFRRRSCVVLYAVSAGADMLAWLVCWRNMAQVHMRSTQIPLGTASHSQPLINRMGIHYILLCTVGEGMTPVRYLCSVRNALRRKNASHLYPNTHKAANLGRANVLRYCGHQLFSSFTVDCQRLGNREAQALCCRPVRICWEMSALHCVYPPAKKLRTHSHTHIERWLSE